MKRSHIVLFRYFFGGMDLIALNIVNLVLVSLLSQVNGHAYQYELFFLISNLAWLFSAYANAVYIH
ncbi:MAG TPA: hypothetical protein VLJ68_03440, partial [Chitinophagaceae bacterium]|nr:hypothetical protein [Chitinophagaceae bacterium]